MADSAQLVFDAGRMRVGGVVDFSSVVSLLRRGEDWLRDQAPVGCRLDLSGVSHCNSAVAALLLSWLRAARAAGKELTVENVPDDLRGQMELAGLEDVLPTP
ncbi:MAG: STAS domain-containing protein [Halioglobus sp.]|nr:STAS domain-containing protein [Halioglobus sp.]MCB1708683.1 STAS domain-containing protein [Halioglobus sp.]MCP5121958.1 STAS domain-containing protein [Pseudomonadales bacterium]MCP5192503.1 STAS domain-containing protein [Pseudomonadales bacterium]